jgi:hypothetical protein
MKTECVIERSGIPAVNHANLPVVIPREPSLQDWADRINASWDAAVKNFIETGRGLLASRASHQHGQWDRLFKDHPCHVARPIRCTRQTAFRLMAIAKHPILSDVTHVYLLPRHWGTLYELTKLPEWFLKRLLTQGRIHPELTRSEAQVWVFRLGAGKWGTSPRKPVHDDHAIAHLVDLNNMQEALVNWAHEINAVLQEPLRVDESGKIVSGVWWLPPIAGPALQQTPPPKPQHRCECGHEHMDQRTRRRQ